VPVLEEFDAAQEDADITWESFGIGTANGGGGGGGGDGDADSEATEDDDIEEHAPEVEDFEAGAYTRSDHSST
jgi:hypothetical protein